MLRIGIDVGGTKAAYGLLDEHGNMIDRMEHPTPIGIDGAGLSDMILENVRALIGRSGLTESDIAGIGICMPSFIIYETGYIYMTSALVNIRDFAMKDYLSERISVPIVLDNDSNVAALAEHRFGAGRGSRHMVYMATSTGIGSGLILNGELFRGSYGWAGETGHMLITPDEGVECGCRNRGCFMSHASGRYIPELIREKAAGRQTMIDLNGALDGRALKAACEAGDRVAMEALESMAHYIAVCCFNIYQLLNVNLFVFGGGLTAFGPMLYDRIRAEFDRYNHIDLPVEFRFAELKRDVGIIGAAALVG